MSRKHFTSLVHEHLSTDYKYCSGDYLQMKDFHLFLLGMLAMVLFVVLFTVVYGRVFCGWACPQTIFMELVFRKIEYWIEGDYKEQMALDKAPFSTQKLVKKSVKHFLFFAVSFIISNLFLSYIIGTEGLWKIVSDSPQNHLGQLGAMILFTYVFYFVYARFREQVCTTVCPYGRLQGVMLDKHSINVTYDYVRGETRGFVRRGEDRKQAGKGDCVDCSLCVSVCPTGIDIRNGTQLECINCTACIDACDAVMHKIGLPKGLIRYASEEGIAQRQAFRWTKRVVAYSIVLLLLVVSLAVLLVTRPEVETSVLRTPGILYQSVGNNQYSNLYNVKVVNKTRKDIPLEFKLLNVVGEIREVGNPMDVKPKSIAEGAFFIVLNEKDLQKMKTKLKIGVYDGAKLVETVETTFIGPATH